MPVAWDEITTIYPPDFTVLTAMDRIEQHADPWEHILDAKHDIRTLFGLGS